MGVWCLCLCYYHGHYFFCVFTGASQSVLRVGNDGHGLHAALIDLVLAGLRSELGAAMPAIARLPDSAFIS